MFGREHVARHAGWLGGSPQPAQGRKRPEPVPLVPARGSQGPHHLLFGLVRRGMEAAQRPRLSPREGAAARPRRLRILRRGLCGGVDPHQEAARSGPLAAAGALGIETRIAKELVGCRPHPADSGRRGRVRLVEPADAMFTVPPGCHPGSPATLGGTAQRRRRIE